MFKNQWRFQDFPEDGCYLQRWGTNLYMITWPIFPENLLENERNWTEKGTRPWRSLDLPMKMGATCSVNDAFAIYTADKKGNAVPGWARTTNLSVNSRTR